MRKPNIIFICSDQHRADTIGAYGSRVCRTPALDRLAEQGTRFGRCFANNPVCSPSRATIITGCQGRRHGVVNNGIPCPEDMPTLPGILREYGYRTIAVGKLHISPQQEGVREGPYYGFEHYEQSEDPKIGPYLDWALENYPEHEGYLVGTLFNLPTNEDYWKGRRDFRPEVAACRAKHVAPLEISANANWGYGHYSPLPAAAHQTTWITDRAIDLVQRHDAEQPLMMWVGYQDPHNPFDPPREYSRLYRPEDVEPIAGLEADESLMPPHLRAYRECFKSFTETDWRTLKALYYGSVTFMDDAIGRLIASLEAKLDMSNTIVLYASDHGEILGDHGICGKAAYHYDSGIRVPMIGRWDGHWPAGTERSDVMELADLAPTLLDAAGIAHDAVMDGRSLAGAFGGGADAGHPFAYVESYNGGPGDPTPAPHCWARTVRNGKWRCTFYPGADHGELFDMASDPRELINLWNEPAYRGVVESCRKALLDRLILMDFPVRRGPYGV